MGNESRACAMQSRHVFRIKLIVQRELMESLGTTKNGSKLYHLLKGVFNEFFGCINPRFTPKHPACY